MKNENDIVVSLDQLERLLVEMPFDPARPQYPPGPVIDRVAQRLLSSRLPPPGARLVVRLTSQAVTPELQNRSGEALRRLCQQRVEQNRLQARNTRRAGWLALGYGLLLLVVSLALSAMFEHFRPLPEMLNRLFSEGFLILGWVVLWHPLETLLYDWVLPYRLGSVFDRLGRMSLVLDQGEKTQI